MSQPGEQGLGSLAAAALLMGGLLAAIFSEMGHQTEHSLALGLLVGSLPFLLNGLLFGTFCGRDDERNARLASWGVAAVLLAFTVGPTTHSPLNHLIWMAIRRQPLPTPAEALPSALIPVSAVFAANALGFSLAQWRRRARLPDHI